MEQYILPYTTWVDSTPQKNQWVIMEVSHFDKDYRAQDKPQFVTMYKVGDFRKKKTYKYALVLQRVYSNALTLINKP